MHYSVWSFFGCFGLFFSSNSFAESPNGMFSVDLGTANVSRAHADSAGIVQNSPGLMSLVPRYQMEVMGYAQQSWDWGMGVTAFDSTQGPFSLGFVYLRERNQTGLGNDYLPGWRLPEEELETFSIDSILGAAFGISFANRTVAFGMSSNYLGSQNDKGQSIHGFELNPSLGAKFLEQFAVVATVADALNSNRSRQLNGGVRWGILEPVSTQLPWASCEQMLKEQVYHSVGGIEFDWAFDTNRSAMDMLGASFDLPLACTVMLRGGYSHDFTQSHDRYGLGIGIDSIRTVLSYDVMITPLDGAWLHQHLFSIRLRFAPWNPGRMPI